MSRSLPPDPWVDAACKATPAQLIQQPDYAYPKGAGRARHWKEIEFVNKYCNVCPIKKFCENQGKKEEYGIWGGRTEDQRKNSLSILKMFG